MKRPPKVFCADCGREIGRGWSSYRFCDDCRPNHDTECTCSYPDFDPDCLVHLGRDPYDIPY